MRGFALWRIWKNSDCFVQVNGGKCAVSMLMPISSSRSYKIENFKLFSPTTRIPKSSPSSSPSQKIRMAISRKQKELSELRWLSKKRPELWKLLRDCFAAHLIACSGEFKSRRWRDRQVMVRQPLVHQLLARQPFVHHYCKPMIKQYCNTLEFDAWRLELEAEPRRGVGESRVKLEAPVYLAAVPPFNLL